MGTDARGDLAAMVDEYRAMSDGLQRMSAELASMQGTARSADGAVTATVNARGELSELAIDPELSARLDSRSLAARVVEAASQAAAAVREQTRDQVRGVLPERLRPAVTDDGTVDIAQLLPRLGRITDAGGR